MAINPAARYAAKRDVAVLGGSVEDGTMILSGRRGDFAEHIRTTHFTIRRMICARKSVCYYGSSFEAVFRMSGAP